MQVIEPLLDFIFDAGISIPELVRLIRERSVHLAAKRTLKEGGRLSKSRVAIITGLPRTEVSRILNSPNELQSSNRGQNPARRVLAGWYENSEFLTKEGEPAILPIFGKRKSFERLTAIYGGGIPVRAMLDELTLLKAVVRLSNQKVRPRVRLTVLAGQTQSAIAAVGERGRDLIETLTGNVRNGDDPLFEATAVVNDADDEMVGFMRREVAAQGASFINGIHTLLTTARKPRTAVSNRNSMKFRLGVTAFYFQDLAMSVGPTNQSDVDTAKRPRKNLRRAGVNVSHSVD